MQSTSCFACSPGLVQPCAVVCFHRAFDMTRDIQQGLLLVLRIPYFSILMSSAVSAQRSETCAQSHISVMC